MNSTSEKELVETIRRAGDEMAREKGELSLLGLFQREEGIGNWDVVVAAPWISREDRTADIPYLVGKLQSVLNPSQMASVSIVVPVHSSAPFVETVRWMAGEVDGVKMLSAFDYDGMALRRAYVLLSRPESKSVPHAASAGV